MSTEILEQIQTPNLRTLKKYISNRSLTDCLELLEERGYTGDIAIFLLASLQGGAV